MAQRTLKMYRVLDDCRRLSAGAIAASSPIDLVARWTAFLATAERGTYIATYRGETLNADCAASERFAALGA
jgi:hypothetical protein